MLELPTPKDSAHLTKPMGVVFANLAPVGKIDPYFISGIGGLHHFVFGNFQQLMESLHGGDSRLTHANRRNLIGFDQGDLQPAFVNFAKARCGQPASGTTTDDDNMVYRPHRHSVNSYYRWLHQYQLRHTMVPLCCKESYRKGFGAPR